MNFLEFINNNLPLTIIGAVTLVQVSPIKVNPWSWIGKQVKNCLGIADIQDEICKIKDDIMQYRVTSWRWNILDFGNSCRNGRRHSKEEWAHMIDQLAKYERYCHDNNIENGVIVEESLYLRGLYRERLEKNDFL